MKLLAPNGNKSNLTAKQYELVRMTEFKAWFGDWENLILTKLNDSGIDEVSLKRLEDGVSKVLDENGEPLVVYHYTNIRFNEFRLKGLSDAFFFTKYKNDDEFSYEQTTTKKYFLNIKNMHEVIDIPYYEWSIPYYESQYIKKGRLLGADGLILTREGFDNNFNLIPEKSIILSFNPTQIKLADGSNTTFDSGNPDIRLNDGGEISRNIDGQLKKLGFTFNPANYRYSKTVDENTYISAYYDKNKRLYKIGGISKFKTPLGENSVGIKFDYNNEKEFWNKINEYISIQNPNIRFDYGGKVGREFTGQEVWDIALKGGSEHNDTLEYLEQDIISKDYFLKDISVNEILTEDIDVMEFVNEMKNNTSSIVSIREIHQPIVIGHNPYSGKNSVIDGSNRVLQAINNGQETIKGFVPVDSKTFNDDELKDIIMKKGGDIPKLYRGGDIEQYNKWKAVDWDSFNSMKQDRSKIYRLMGWHFSNRIDWDKMPKEDREFFEEDVVYALNEDSTLEYLFSDNVKEISGEYEDLLEDERLEDIEDIKKLNKKTTELLNSKEFSSLKEKMDAYGFSEKDLQTKSDDELLEIAHGGKDIEWITDYVLLNDDNWYNFNWMFYPEDLPKIYDEALERGAVFTEEAEMQQYDMFTEAPAKPKDERKFTKKEIFENTFEYSDGKNTFLVHKDGKELSTSVTKPNGENVRIIKHTWKELKEAIIKSKGSPREEPKPKEIVYVSFLNKDKGFKEDKKYFESYADAEAWARSKLEKFSHDFIHYDDNPEALELQDSIEGTSILLQEIDSELEVLNDLLEDAKEEKNKGLISELKDRIDFLEELREDEREGFTLKNGGEIADVSKINIIFNNNYLYPKVYFFIEGKNGKNIEIGYSYQETYSKDINTLTLHKFIIEPKYNTPANFKKIVELIKEGMNSNTGKTKLIINNVTH